MDETISESLLYRIVRPIVTFLFKAFFTPKIIGKEKIKQNGKLILVGNHTHNFDCLLLMASTKRCIHFLAKKELWNGPKKIIFSNMGLIPVDRKRKNAEAIFEAENYLNHEKLVGIFPEGTTEKEKGKLLPFKMGAVKMAHDTDSEIVPFIIKGDYKLFSRNLSIEFYDPIKIKSDDIKLENEKLETRFRKSIEGEKHENI